MMIKSKSDKVYLLLIAMICFAVFLVVCVIGWEVYQENKVIEVEKLQNNGVEIANRFDQYFNIHEVTLKIVAAEAQSVLNHDKLPLNISVLDLIPEKEFTGYSLRIPKGKNNDQVGNLTGLGEIPEIGSSASSEIGMALSLSPIFEQVIENNNTLPWIYYTSMNRFIYMYPRVSTDAFFYSDDLLSAEFFVIATPEKDPTREMVWTSLYEDHAGMGWMITLSKPVYDNDQFLGVLSIDVGVSDLEWILESIGMSNAEAYLMGPAGNVMASTGNTEFDITLDLSDTHHQEIYEDQGHSLMVFPLSKVEWYVVLDIDNKQLVLDTIRDSSSVGFIILFVFFSLGLILITTYYMRSFRYLSIHDPLTGIQNRRGFEEFAHKLTKKRQPENSIFGLAIVDIDWFKKYNDHYGHTAGDNILRRVANALRNCMRSPADQVFRIGGEEFAVIISKTNSEELPLILDRLLASVYELGIPHAQSQYQRITISIGAASTKIGVLPDLHEIYNRADRARYTAKESGRNRWIFME